MIAQYAGVSAQYPAPNAETSVIMVKLQKVMIVHFAQLEHKDHVLDEIGQIQRYASSVTSFSMVRVSIDRHDHKHTAIHCDKLTDGVA